MSDLSPSAYVVLGMLRLGARSGYEIKKGVELSVRHFWALGFSQIYPELKRLEKAGLIAGRPGTGGRRKRLYELQPDGERALHDWLVEQVDEAPLELRDLSLVKLFFAGPLDVEGRLAIVEQIRRRSESKLRTLTGPTLEGAEYLAEHGDESPLLTLQYGLEQHRAVLRWCDAAEKRLTSPTAAGPAPPGEAWPVERLEELDDVPSRDP